jgi:hypothetical protein
MGNKPSSSPPACSCKNQSGRINDYKNEIYRYRDDMNNVKNTIINDKNKYDSNKATYNDYNNNKIPKRKKEYEDRIESQYTNITNLKKEQTRVEGILQYKNRIIYDCSLSETTSTSYNNLTNKGLLNMLYQNNYLKKKIIESSEQLYGAIHSENSVLNNRLDETRALYSTDGSKSSYKEEQTNSFNIFNGILFFIYYILLLVLVYSLYSIDNISNFLKIVIIIVFILYPILVSDFQKKISFFYDIIMPHIKKLY